ncbi:MAG: BatA domain-containing protein, partial [Gemmatimonadota bacterium]|nr:BatA domain-containing protein [Gemmatimonadota bacterium]
MTFLNPWFLLGLAATAVPVVIHLLSRRTARRQDFSTLDFLLELEKRSLRRLRIRRLLLLLL